MIEKITKFIRDEVEKAKANGVVIGLSGGIDSTVTAFLCVKALGKDKVLGLIMPEKMSKIEDIEDAKMVAELLGIKYKIIDITDILKAFGVYSPVKEFEFADANLKPRVRMCLLYYYANKYNLLVVGTGNKSEWLTGYFTKYGDGAADIYPILDLYKTDVRNLAKELKVPEKIIMKTPSAGLWEGQTDEEELGISYDLLDKILILYEKGKNAEEISRELNIDIKKVEHVFNLIKKSEHKRAGVKYPKVRE
ncbi:NAD+ synthetase [Methanocaldococcus villosus KIN24-T80]|uniref:NH(3)-dependent NAD(+) synthetase n=1 Tax=Methanocaldococcus villosus KIN24-T80 TaxID=1069083 RepID=N6VPA5_9EURY|nr:NAD+ synthase [Methanocaldococcus villosus]ENN95705.1 NAD+ synthetase [Methanocaldococcus villosus KIN24-T80]